MNVLKGDWYSDRSRIGLGAGWRCRKCGTWVDVDSPLKCLCNTESVEVAMSGESPTVVKLKNDLDKLQRQRNELADLLIILADQHVMKHDGKFRGPYSTRINAALGL